MATIHDVAREAQVSIATVSRALNNRSRVSEATRERVLAVAHVLDFHPNRAARGLVTGKLGNVGVLVPDITNPFFAPIVAGIEQVAQLRDMGVFIADTRENPDAEGGLITRLGQQVDGLILVASRMDDEDLLGLRLKDSTVLVNRTVEGISSVAIDAYQGMAELVTNLARLGHTSIAYFDGPARSSLGRAKLAGIEDTCARLGLGLDHRGHHDPSFGAGRRIADDIGRTGRVTIEATAVIAFDDLIAWGLLTRLSELGISVPADLSIAGFDDAIEEGMVRPALTSVAADGLTIGTEAMGKLLTRLDDEDAPATALMLDCTVQMRASTAPVS